MSALGGAALWAVFLIGAVVGAALAGYLFFSWVVETREGFEDREALEALERVHELEEVRS